MCSIPSEIDNQENILRTIFSPANFNAKGKLRGNFMRPQFSKADEDDPTIASNKISVTRVDHVSINFCKDHAKSHSSKPNRLYWGFARFITSDIRSTPKVDVSSKPVEDNPAHANIVYDFKIPISNGETIDAEYEIAIKTLVKKAQIMADHSPNNANWEGDVI